MTDVPRYLDHAATSPVRREVLEAMWPFLTTRFGNPSSVHALGQDAATALETARSAIAAALGGRASEVILTSGGTESDNLAVKGLALARRASSGAARVIISAVEHPAVLESARWLGTLGFQVSELGVDAAGRVDPAELAELLAAAPATGGDAIATVSVQLANNEVGTIQPIAALGALTRAAGVPLHTDAVQAAGSIAIDVGALGVAALSISGHKLGAPKGTGALWLRRGVRLEPLLHGGGQERGLRSGTQDVAGAVGLAVALEAARRSIPGGDRARGEVSDGGIADGGAPGGGVRLAPARDAFVARVLAGLATVLPQARLTGHPSQRLPGHASFVLGSVSGESVLLELERRGVLVSSGSACQAGSDEPSHVLLAMGLSPELAQTAVRFTFPAGVSGQDLDPVADSLIDVVTEILT